MTHPEPGGLRVIAVDLDRCVGHGKCYAVAPDLMRPFDDDGRAEFYGAPIDPADSKRVASGNAAIDSCPEAAPAWTAPSDG